MHDQMAYACVGGHKLPAPPRSSAGGAPILAPEILSYLRTPGDEEEEQAGSPLDSAISQEHHPFLDRPFFQIHPCATQDVLALLLADRPPGLVAYMVAWLSVQCQLVPLTVPVSLAGLRYDPPLNP